MTCGSCCCRYSIRCLCLFLMKNPLILACSCVTKDSLASHNCSLLYSAVTELTTPYVKKTMVFTQRWENNSVTLKIKTTGLFVKGESDQKKKIRKEPGFLLYRDGHLCDGIPPALPMYPGLSPDCSNRDIYHWNNVSPKHYRCCLEESRENKYDTECTCERTGCLLCQQLFKLPLLAPFAWLSASFVWYVSAQSGCTALSPALGSCKACSVFLESPLATFLLMSAIAPATNTGTNISQTNRCLITETTPMKKIPTKCKYQ